MPTTIPGALQGEIIDARGAGVLVRDHAYGPGQTIRPLDMDSQIGRELGAVGQTPIFFNYDQGRSLNIGGDDVRVSEMVLHENRAFAHWPALTESAINTALLYSDIIINASQITGTARNDSMFGSSVGDRFAGGSGYDHMVMGGGDDVAFGGGQNDHIRGDAGNDRLYGENGHDDLLGGVGNDAIWGGKGHDYLWGEAGRDTLRGGSGNDTIIGEGGRDKIYGNSGDDLIAGGAGNDVLRGGSGADVFEFIGTDLGDDRIEDFVSGEDFLVFGTDQVTYDQRSDGVLVTHDEGTVLLVGIDMGDLLA